MTESPENPTTRFGLTIAHTKLIYATHTHYVGEELLQQLDDGSGSTGGSGGGGASAHIRVDWDAPPELQGYGVVVYFVMGSPDNKHSIYHKGRDTKRYSAEENVKHTARTAKPFVRAVSRNTPVTPIPNAPKGPLG
jgi:hypothetical protein